jgi:hypothetical protein
MEITPHNTLDTEEDAVKRKNAKQEAMIYKDLAAKSDWEQLNVDNKYTVGENGELIDKETGKPIETGGDNSSYKQDEKTGEWLKDGKPIFKGLQYYTTAGGGGGGGGGGGLASPGYGHKDMNWKKPDWMKVSFVHRKKNYSLFLSCFRFNLNIYY